MNDGTAPPPDSRLWVKGAATADLVSYDTNYYNHGYHEVSAPTSNSTIHLIHYGYYGQTFNTQGKDEALVISHSGDVGIGNPKPTEPLVVEGNVSASGVGYFDDGIQVKPADHERILTTFNASATFAEQFILEHFDGDVVFRNPRGSMQISSSLQFKDSVKARFGNDNDLDIYWDGSNSYIENNNEHLIIVNNENDHDIYLKSDNGAGGTTNYITLDGSSATTIHQRPAFFGTSFTSATTTLHVSASGVNGILIDEDGANNDISSRLLFREQNSTIALYNTGDTFSFRTGATVNSTSGTERFQVNTNGARVVDGALGVDLSPSTTDGRIDAANDVVAFSTSDKRLKENIKPLDSALDKVLQINGVSFDWKELTEEEKKTIHGNEGHDVGVIAQEVEKVLPEVVTTRDSGYKAVKYEKLVPLLIESIKELKKEIEELKK
jgi:hypothetical protein